MKGLLIVALIVVSWIITSLVGEYNTILGEILGMAMIQPLLVIFLLIVFLILFRGLPRRFKKKKDNSINSLTDNLKENSCYDHDCGDLYLRKSILASDFVDYQIISKKKIILYRGKCNLSQGRINSIILYSGDANTEIVLQVEKKTIGSEYIVKDRESALGLIIITKSGLSYNNIDNNVIHTATLETAVDDGLGVVADWLVALDTLTVFSSESKFNYFILKGKDGETLGKYLTPLQNLDLTADTENKYDKRIAIIFSIIIDTALPVSFE